MSTIVIFLAALLACSLLAGWLIKVRSRRRQLPWTNAFADAQTRKLTSEERSAVENYLESLTQVLQVPGPTGASAAPISLALNAESNNVMMLTHAITRYGISTDDPNKWRYYLDSVEVHLPPFWEQYINDENTVELIHTDSLPLVISLNGHTLQEYMQEIRGYALQPVPSTQASIRGEESEQIELLNIRKETHEEYALSRPRGLREALLIVASFLMFVELIHTDSLPLVISLNGHTLQEYMQEIRGYALQPVPSTQASIRGEESEQIELLNIRKETHEEYALSRPRGLREALLIVASFLMFFFCLITPDVFVPWLAGGALLLLGAGLWGLFAPPAKSSLREIHCLRGTPRRWGLFGENDQEQINNISLGIIDLVYPAHWQPYIAQDLGQQTDMDIYLDRHVVRQGRYLSLHDEVKNFPLQHWLRSTIIAAGSLLVLFMLLFWIPLDMPLKFTLSWMKGAQTIEATSVKQLADAGVRVGDTLRISGTGMCNIRTSGTWSAKTNSPFLPFDCSQIIWNDARSLPLPESELVNKATALTEAVNRQLHPKPEDESRVSASLRSAIQKSGMVLLDDFGDIVLKTADLCSAKDDCVRLKNAHESRVSASLRSAIQKSGMVLLDDFGDIVLKTADLCSAKDDCVRLKNALVNLGNSKDWDALVKRANAGKLDGVNVLLRPVSAESLDNLVATSTAPFITHETARAAQSLNSPAPGGFLIVSDEGSDFVDQPWPSASLYDYPPQEQWNAFQKLAQMLMHTPFNAEQWNAFQKLAQMLMHTPFNAEGIVTKIFTDANGTQHIGLHPIPDRSGLWRYLSTTLLLLTMLGSAIYNGVQAWRRYQRHRTRMMKIQAYYESCLNPHYLSTTLLLLTMLGSAIYNGVQAWRRYQRHRTRMMKIQAYYESCLNPQLITPSESLIE